MQLLHIDSSVLGPNSASRALSADIVARQVALHPGMTVIHRDLATDAALHLSSAHLAAWQGGTVADEELGSDLAKGGAYLEELVAADIIVIGAPITFRSRASSRRGSTVWSLPAKHFATAQMVRKGC
jgi:FMN-dependent NADH-azoreductase